MAVSTDLHLSHRAPLARDTFSSYPGRTLAKGSEAGIPASVLRPVRMKLARSGGLNPAQDQFIVYFTTIAW